MTKATTHSDTFTALTAQYIAEGSQKMHGIPTRTDPKILADEVLRLNRDVREAAAHGIDPFLQPASIARVLETQADVIDVTSATTPPTLQPVSSAQPTLTQTAQRLRNGQTTCVELTQQSLETVRQTQPTLNAFLEVWGDAALETAHQRDLELKNGQDRGLLHGIPMAHKDCFNIKGHAATIGSRARVAQPSQTDATLITKLNQAGAINIGSLNLSEMVAGPTGHNPIFGDCANALDPQRISGGSSSGSATAVASNAVFASIGSDTGGSIRIPASVQGLFGLKPTYGLISRAGCFPRAYSVDCPGPLTRSAQDCAAVLQVVAGHDPDDPSTLRAEVPDYLKLLDSAAHGSRLGVLSLASDNQYDPDVAGVFNAFIENLEPWFSTVRSIEYPNVARCNALSDILSKVEAATVHSQWMRSNPNAYSQAVYTRTETGLHIPAVRYMESLISRIGVLEDFLAEQMRDIDLLICPTIIIPTPRRQDINMDDPQAMLTTVSALTRMTRPFNYLGLPALTMPIGTDQNGMPVGAQIVGRPLAEARLLSFAHITSIALANRTAQ